MDWTSLIGPAVVAAAISAIVAWITTSRRFKVDRDLVDRKIQADITLAEKKFEFDQKLAQKNVELSIMFSEKKLALDKELAIWKRLYELAEQVLAAAYEARDALNEARGRGIFAGEGETRKATEVETDKVREARNSAYVPIERLTCNAKAFATLQALQDPMAAQFGPEAIKPLAAIAEVHRSITRAASLLIQMADLGDDHLGRQQLVPLREVLWGDGRKDDDRKLDAAIEQLEAICRPVLSAKAPA